MMSLHLITLLFSFRFDTSGSSLPSALVIFLTVFISTPVFQGNLMETTWIVCMTRLSLFCADFVSVLLYHLRLSSDNFLTNWENSRPYLEPEKIISFSRFELGALRSVVQCATYDEYHHEYLEHRLKYNFEHKTQVLIVFYEIWTIRFLYMI